MSGEARFHMPAEWAVHRATWFSWPHNLETWPDCLPGAERALVQAVVALSAGEDVMVNVRDAAHGRHVASLLRGQGNADRIRLLDVPTNDAWCRDHGAIFVHDERRRLTALDFRFNAWGGKYPPFDLDDAAAGRMAQHLGVPCVRVDMVLEGGAIDVNGRGTLLTTEQCLLNTNRNPNLSREEIESALRRYLGAEQIVWLGDGIVGDDTDGHVDDLTRFVAEDTVVTAIEDDVTDPNHAPLAENLERLRAVRLPDGKPLRILELPMPRPLLRDGRPLPASYANFYIGNEVVLLPVFACPEDEAAASVLASVFPGRRIVPIDCRDVVVGLGTMHCLSQQVPAG